MVDFNLYIIKDNESTYFMKCNVKRVIGLLDLLILAREILYFILFSEPLLSSIACLLPASSCFYPFFNPSIPHAPVVRAVVAAVFVVVGAEKRSAYRLLVHEVFLVNTLHPLLYSSNTLMTDGPVPAESRR